MNMSPSLTIVHPRPKLGRPKAKILVAPEGMRLYEFLRKHPLTIEQLATLTCKSPRVVAQWLQKGEAPESVQVMLGLLHEVWRWD
jgi:hypothetical protein